MRPLNDIDLDIPEERFLDILEDVRPYIVEDPMRFKNVVWDVFTMSLEYHGQEIDIGGAYTTRVFDRKTGVWHDAAANF